MHEIIRMPHLVACPIVFILFYDRDWQRGVFKVMNWVLFPKIFGQVKARLILGLHKIIRVSHVVACSIVFILFWQGGVLKFMKNDHFLVFLTV